MVGSTREGYRFVWDLTAPATLAANSEWWTEAHDECHTNNYRSDCRPPAAIGDFRLEDGALKFTATGDDWRVGANASYALRTSAAPIATRAGWDAAEPLTPPAGVQTAGTAVSLPLPATAKRYVALLAFDEANNSTPIALVDRSPGTGALSISLSADRTGGDVTAAPVDVTFTATATDSHPEAGTLTYTFYFGDGANSGRQTAATAQHSYAKAGTYRAHVIVADEANQSADSEVVEITTTTTVTVTGDTTTSAKLSVSLSGSVAPVTATFDDSGSTAAQGATISDYAFDFGDGSAVVHRSESGTVQHVYTTPGSFTATLTVTDSAGGSSQATATVTVTDAQQTTAQLVISPTTVKTGETVTFDGSSSIPANGKTITSYAFDFGDGSPVVSGAASTATHAYSSPGTYTPTLTVTDDANPPAISQAKSKVAVSAPAASPSRGGGGALGWLTLLPLLGATLRRRGIAASCRWLM
jgi:PKD repeat protein